MNEPQKNNKEKKELWISQLLEPWLRSKLGRKFAYLGIILIVIILLFYVIIELL